MEASVTPHDHNDQEEYLLLDLDSVSGQLDIPPNAKYVLTVSCLTCELCFFFIIVIIFMSGKLLFSL